MNFSVVERADTFILATLKGSLDLTAARKIEGELLASAAEKRSLILDFSEVDFVGSMGMRLLIGASKSLALAGKKLIVFQPQAPVEKVLDAAGMTNVLTLVSDEAKARAAVV